MMTPIAPSIGSADLLATLSPAPGAAAGAMLEAAHPQQAASNDELRERFTQFVGETFFGQMIKAMRSTCGKPAYFHGGRGEEVFRGQLDLTLAEHMSEASASRFTEPLFDRQFPHLAQPSVPAPQRANDGLAQLESLPRR